MIHHSYKTGIVKFSFRTDRVYKTMCQQFQQSNTVELLFERKPYFAVMSITAGRVACKLQFSVERVTQ